MNTKVKEDIMKVIMIFIPKYLGESPAQQHWGFDDGIPIG